MECSILSEVDDTSFSGRGSPRRYGRPLNWLPASNLLPAQRAGAQRLCAMAPNCLRSKVTIVPRLKVNRLSAADNCIAPDPFVHNQGTEPDIGDPSRLFRARRPA